MKKIISVHDWSPEKDCCLWLTFRQPVRQPSSESWRWLPYRLSKRQSQTTVVLGTPVTQVIFFDQGISYSWIQTIKLKKLKLAQWRLFGELMTFCLHSIWWTNYAKSGLVGGTYNELWIIKDLLLGAHVVVETLNLEIPRCCLLRRQRMLLRLVPHVYHDYIFLFLQSDRHCFLELSLLLLSALLKLPIIS